MSLLLCFCFCSNAMAFVETKPDKTLVVNLSLPNQFFAFEDYTPSSAVIVKVTGLKTVDETYVSCKYKIESIVWRDTKELPKFELLGTNLKKGDRFVILYSRHISYWGDSFINHTALKLDGNNVIMSQTDIITLSNLKIKLQNQTKSDLNLSAQAKTATLILEGKVLDVTGDGSADYAFANIKPIKVYKGATELDKNLVINVYRPLKKGKTYIFLLKEGSSDLPGDSPALFTVDKEAQFTIASSKFRKDIQKALDSQ